MFDQLFSGPRAVHRYLSGPLLESRLQYLHHCRAQGATTATLRNIAFYQCAISRSIDLQVPRTFCVEQIRAGADRWTSRAPTHHARKNGDAGKVAFMSVAMGWLSFLGRVERAQTPECRALGSGLRTALMLPPDLANASYRPEPRAGGPRSLEDRP